MDVLAMFGVQMAHERTTTSRDFGERSGYGWDATRIVTESEL